MTPEKEKAELEAFRMKLKQLINQVPVLPCTSNTIQIAIKLDECLVLLERELENRDG